MQCPHENATLAASTSAKGLACPKCFGRWLGFRDVEALAQTHHVSTALMFEDLALTAKETKLKCPKGCGTLKVSSLPGVEVDWCQICKGVWFDNGELKNLLAMHGGRINTDAIAGALSVLDFLALLALPWK